MATLTEQDFLDQSLRNAYPAFRFTLEIANSYSGLFSECTLPNVEWEVEEVKEGGLNSYIHQLPGQRKSSSRVILKTGVMRGPLSVLYNWYIDSMNAKFARKTVTIKLLDSDGETALMTWALEDAYPVKWTAPQLKSDSDALAINTLELACGQITIQSES
jgi:phage tail-like protein